MEKMTTFLMDRSLKSVQFQKKNGKYVDTIGIEHVKYFILLFDNS